MGSWGVGELGIGNWGVGDWGLGTEELRNSQTSQLTDNFQLSVFSFQLNVLIPSNPR